MHVEAAKATKMLLNSQGSGVLTRSISCNEGACVSAWAILTSRVDQE